MYGNAYGYFRPGGAKDTAALVLGLISFLSVSCLMPVSIILGALAVLMVFRYRKAGGAWGWKSVLGLCCGIIGCLFGVFLTALAVYFIVTKNPDSIYGIFASFGK